MTYDALKTAVAGYFGNIDSIDPNFEAMIPSLIQMAESRIYARLRHPVMMKRPYVENLSVNNAPPFLFPEDCLEIHGIVDVDGREWEYITPDLMFTGEAARPTLSWTLSGNELVFRPEVSASTICTYYARPASVTINASNILFSLFPQLFLYGSLAEAAAYLREPQDVLALHEQRFERQLAEADMTAWNAKIPAGMPLQIRSR